MWRWCPRLVRLRAFCGSVRCVSRSVRPPTFAPPPTHLGTNPAAPTSAADFANSLCAVLPRGIFFESVTAFSMSGHRGGVVKYKLLGSLLRGVGPERATRAPDPPVLGVGWARPDLTRSDARLDTEHCAARNALAQDTLETPFLREASPPPFSVKPLAPATTEQCSHCSHRPRRIRRP